MIPVIIKIGAHSVQQFGDLSHHAGEEFVYVLKGNVVVDHWSRRAARVNEWS